ncbi:hypothetical protein WBP06_14665 [Novosphingobium sp. BL-8H]|uniref:hypothetical protein n=1 Tax=Novosphingobium sp. BL-8H TaxID=3127640 RepID=UPI003757B36E
MSRYYPAWNGIQVLPEDLIKFAWSEPMRDLATKIGMSDVGLGKLVISMDIVARPRGNGCQHHAGPSNALKHAKTRYEILLQDSNFCQFVQKFFLGPIWGLTRLA